MEVADIFKAQSTSFVQLNHSKLLTFEPETAILSPVDEQQQRFFSSSRNHSINDVAIPDFDSIANNIINNNNLTDLASIFGGLQVDAWDGEFHRIINVLHVYVLPVIILIGIVGNTLSFFVYVGTPRLYRQSSSLYLAFLAAVDNISLIFIFVVWFGMVGVHLLHKNGWCQTVMYCTYVCSFLSAWTVVSFTCERWIVVFHPLKRHRLCTRRRAIVVMTSLTVGSMAFYSFSLFSQGVQRYASNGVSGDLPVCVTLPQYNSLLRVIQSIDTIVVVVVPMFAIFIMNAAIGIKICHYTGRDTFDRYSEVIGRPAAAKGGGGGDGGGGNVDHGHHGDGESPGENRHQGRRQPLNQHAQNHGGHNQNSHHHHHHHHHHHNHHQMGCSNSGPDHMVCSNCSAQAAAGQYNHNGHGYQQHQQKYTAHEHRSAGTGNGFHLALQLQPLQTASGSGTAGGGYQLATGGTGTAAACGGNGGGVGLGAAATSVGGGLSPCAGTATATTAVATTTVHATPGGRSWRILTRKQHTQLRITRGLLIVSTVFVALNLPSYAFRIHAFVIGLKNEPYPISLHAFIWQEFIQFLYYSNFSSRFFLYSACSRNFRDAVYRLLACRGKRPACFSRR